MRKAKAFLLSFSCMLLLFTSWVNTTMATTSPGPSSQTLLEGQVLFAPMDSRTTYLIDPNGAVNHTWTSDYLPGESVRWVGDGTILRTMKVGMSWTGGSGGAVQKVTWDGVQSWYFEYNTADHLAHHDVCPLPNGNVLMIAWEAKTSDEATEAGRDPAHIPGGRFWPDHIIEVKPTGPTSGDIVWEWHVWDHLVQDFDATKKNYGDVAAHPELVDLNYQIDDEWYPPSSDWLHMNAIDYNPAFDQILLSAHNFNEIWIIDHSTTSTEAAGHTGGRSGHGGDLLYRWGNPQAYRRGTENDHIFSSQHGANWIKPGCPGAGDILVFNNGVKRHYSSVDELTPPVDANGTYTLQPGTHYGPANLTWTYCDPLPSSFLVPYLSSAERLSTGNTLICNGVKGEFFEVTPDGQKVWSYTNHFPSGGYNNVFNIVYIPPWQPQTAHLDCTGSLLWTSVHPGATVTGSFTICNNGVAGSSLDWTINTSSLTWGNWTITPLSGENLTPEAGSITIQVSVVAPSQSHSTFQAYIRVADDNNPADYDTIPVSLSTSLPQGQHFQGSALFSHPQVQPSTKFGLGSQKT